MIIEFDNGWALRASVTSGFHFLSINHTHETVQKAGGSYIEVNIMPYHARTKCSACGARVPDELIGTVELIKWSLADDN